MIHSLSNKEENMCKIAKERHYKKKIIEKIYGHEKK